MRPHATQVLDWIVDHGSDRPKRSGAERGVVSVGCTRSWLHGAISHKIIACWHALHGEADRDHAPSHIGLYARLSKLAARNLQRCRRFYETNYCVEATAEARINTGHGQASLHPAWCWSLRANKGIGSGGRGREGICSHEKNSAFGQCYIHVHSNSGPFLPFFLWLSGNWRLLSPPYLPPPHIWKPLKFIGVLIVFLCRVYRGNSGRQHRSV
jgi:hypothetical protein